MKMRRHVMSVALVTLVLVAAGCGAQRASSGAATTSRPPASSASSTTVTPAPLSSTSVPATTAAPTTTSPPTTSTVAKPPATGKPPAPPKPRGPAPLTYGDTGPRVLALQQRLSALGYWLGPPDGVFGDSTQQAVFALQKAAGIARDGVVGPNTRAALAAGIVPHPRSTSGYVVEVDLADDLLMFVRDGRLVTVLNTSTGGGYTYVSDGFTAIAETPVGVFHIYSEVDGLVTDSLGQLWRPKYFYSGFAIHGDAYVPPYPVSHGCVRVSNEAIDWIWANNLLPIGTEVWVY